MLRQQHVHNITNDRAFNPLRAGTGIEKTGRHLSYLSPSSSHCLSSSHSLSLYWEQTSPVTTLRLLMIKSEICLKTGFTSDHFSSHCIIFFCVNSGACQLSLITPDAEVQVILALILFSPLTSHHLSVQCSVGINKTLLIPRLSLASVSLTGRHCVTPV